MMSLGSSKLLFCFFFLFQVMVIVVREKKDRLTLPPSINRGHMLQITSQILYIISGTALYILNIERREIQSRLPGQSTPRHVIRGDKKLGGPWPIVGQRQDAPCGFVESVSLTWV